MDRDGLQPGKLSVIPEVLRKSGLRAFEDPFVRIIVIQKRQILLELITKEIRNTDPELFTPVPGNRLNTGKPLIKMKNRLSPKR